MQNISTCSICNHNNLKFYTGAPTNRPICDKCIRCWNRFWHNIIHCIDYDSVKDFYAIFIKNPSLRGLYTLPNIYEKYEALFLKSEDPLKYNKDNHGLKKFERKIVTMAINKFCGVVKNEILDIKQDDIAPCGSRCGFCRIYKMMCLSWPIAKPRINLKKLEDVSWKCNSLISEKETDLEYCLTNLLMITRERICKHLTNTSPDSEKLTSLVLEQEFSQQKSMKADNQTDGLDPELLFANLKISLSNPEPASSSNSRSNSKSKSSTPNRSNQQVGEFYATKLYATTDLTTIMKTFEDNWFEKHLDAKCIFTCGLQIIREFGRVFGYQPDDFRDQTLESSVEANFHQMKRLSMDFDKDNFPSYMKKSNSSSSSPSNQSASPTTFPNFFKLANTCQNHQYSIAFYLLNNPILNERTLKLAEKLVKHFQNYSFSQFENIKTDPELLKILLEMHDYLPAGNFNKHRALTSLYRTNILRILCHFFTGCILYCNNAGFAEKLRNFDIKIINQKTGEEESLESIKRKELGIKQRTGNLEMCEMIRKYNLDYFDMSFSVMWRTMTIFNYSKKRQIFVLPGNFYFTAEDFKNGLDYLIKDEDALSEIKEPFKSWLRLELPIIKQRFFDFADQFQKLTNFEVDLVNLLMCVRMGVLTNSFFELIQKQQNRDQTSASASAKRAKQPITKNVYGTESSFNLDQTRQIYHKAVLFFCHCVLLKYKKLYLLTDKFMNFSTQMGFFMPFLCAVMKPVDKTDEEYRSLVYEISKEMVIQHPWSDSK